MKLKWGLGKILVFVLMFTLSAALAACAKQTTEDETKSTGTANVKDTADTTGTTDATEGKEIPTIKVCIPNYTAPADTAEVVAAINEIMEPKYGVRVNVEFIATGNWVQQTNLMLTSDEVDVLALFGTPFSSFINNGQLLDITDYWEKASSEMKETWSDVEMLPFRSNGRLYAVPNFRDYGGYFGGVIDADIAAEFGIEEGQTLTWEELDEFLHAAKEKYPERYGLVPSGGTALISNWNWDGMGDTKYLGVLAGGGQGSTEVMNLFDTEDFKTFTSWARQWYEDGITMPDIMSNTESWKSMFQANKAIAAITTVGENQNAGLINFYLMPAFKGTDVYQTVSYGINTNTAHPDEAWKVLEALYTDKEIGTLIVNGIEGKNYILNDDGTASYPEGVDASTAGYNLIEAYWFVPYCPISIPAQKNGAEFYNNLVKQSNEANISQAFGFAFDSSKVIDEYTACCNVMDKYYKALMSGAVDPESTMAQARKELEEAGIDIIINEKQTQLDDWLAAN